LRDQVDPTIAAVSTLIVLITTLLLVITQYVGRNK
jgi:putative spermidine/putrescine transport system permease protein